MASTERRFSHAAYYAVVAELEGRVVGSAFLDERSAIASVASITVDPAAQDRMIGRRLMEAILQRVAERRYPGVRLIQAAYNTRSLSLYAKLGFEVREPLVAMQGPPVAVHVPGYTVRRATKDDMSGYVVLGKLYWFSVPLRGIVIATVCYIAGLLVARA